MLAAIIQPQKLGDSRRDLSLPNLAVATHLSQRRRILSSWRDRKKKFLNFDTLSDMPDGVRLWCVKVDFAGILGD
jgi:hypothetical protein